jgi:hypothetical protein
MCVFVSRCVCVCMHTCVCLCLCVCVCVHMSACEQMCENANMHAAEEYICAKVMVDDAKR